MNENRPWQKLLAASAAVLLAVLVAAPLIHADSLDEIEIETISDPVDGYFNRLKVFGLTDDGQLVRFRVSVPHVMKNIGYVSGLQPPDSALVCLDFRVQDGQLYGVGNGGGVYTINTRNAQATFVNPLTVLLEGASFGCDFNPAADRLRIISDTGQNLRHNVNAGGVTITDGTLNYLPVPPATTPTTALDVTGAAYTNNDLDPNTATTLFDIDSALDQVVIQSPPNNGTLVPTGKLGRDTDSPVGFDIASHLVKGVTRQNRAFASLVVDGKSGFYGIDLLTGRAGFLGRLSNTVIDIAVSLQ
jgi:hypothetical protein